MKKDVLLISGMLVGIALPALAQTPPPNPAQSNPANTLQQINGPTPPNKYYTAPPALRGEDHDLAGLDLVKSYPEPKMFTVYTSQSVFWTDNAFLQKQSHVSAFGYSGRFGLAYVPYATRNWTPSINFSYQIIRYDRVSELDFEAMTVGLSSRYDLTKDKSWSITNSYSLQQLNSPRLGLGNFYNESFFDNSLNYVKTLSEKNNLYFLGSAEVGWRLTDPGYYSRVDTSLLFSLVYVPVNQVKLQAYVRPAGYIYTDDQEFNFDTGEILTEQNRVDFNLSSGLMATYSPIDQIALNANLNWTGNFSTVGYREYQAYTPTLTVSGSYAF